MGKFCYFFLLIFFVIFLFSFNSINASTLENPEIKAICAVAIDGNTGKILFAKNPHLKIPPASTVKLVTAMVVLDHLSLSKEIKISERASETPSVYPILYEGEVYTVKDLLYLMLMRSSNQAAVALAEAVAGSEENFSVLMNRKIYSLGLRNSHFVTASGLPAPDQYTTPYELAIIFYEALKYPIIKEIINTETKLISSKNGRTLLIKNTNKLLYDPELKENIVGGKTGFTRASKHCLVNGVNINGRVIITSILGAPNRTSIWEDTKTLISFSKLVLMHKTQPIYITTVVNENLLVSSKEHTKKFFKKTDRKKNIKTKRASQKRSYKNKKLYSKYLKKR